MNCDVICPPISVFLVFWKPHKTNSPSGLTEIILFLVACHIFQKLMRKQWTHSKGNMVPKSNLLSVSTNENMRKKQTFHFQLKRKNVNYILTFLFNIIIYLELINISAAAGAAAVVPLQALKVGCSMSHYPPCRMISDLWNKEKQRCHLKINETLNFVRLNLSQPIIIKAYQNKLHPEKQLN